MGIGCPQTVVDWKMFCRDIAAAYFLNHPEKIGGINKYVEIDETVLCKPKYHKGRELAREQQWFFGGVERGESNLVLGSIIVSDCWKAYGGIEKLPEGYRHYTVNHSIEFKNKETGQHTNSIESQWQKFKQDHKQRYGTNRGLLN
uniref:ISXO2-like transposase domain-containing protein n=1 Tax=Meloidogyne javanica TaxID=6303 RepID=A0A915MNR7_MELJA